MKRKLIIITLIALVASACSISLQPSGSYVDDIYYWPGDVSPALTASDMETLSGNKSQQNKELIVVSELKENEDGSNTLNNYIYAEDEPDWFGEVQAYNLENLNNENQDTIFFDTTEDETVYINNFYVEDENSYSSRIRRFHDPYYYDYDPYWNLSMSWGYHSPYWNSPYYYSHYSYMDPWYYNWYSPWNYYGGYSSWYWGYGGYPYYSYYYGYPHYYGNPHYYNHYTYRDNYEGERRSSRPNTTYSGGGTSRNVANAQNTRSGDLGTVNKSLNPDNRRSVNTTNDIASNQKSGNTNPQNNRSVLTEKRRSTEGTVGQTTVTRSTPVNQNTSTTSPSYRTRTGENNAPVRSTPGGTVSGRTDGNTRTYTPSYNTPRSNTRATYNSNNKSAPASYQNTDRSRSSSGSSTKSGYTIPSTRSGSSTQSGSTTPAKSYSSGTSSSPSNRSSGSYSSGSRSYTPSAPARSGSSYSGSSNRSSGSSSYSSGGSSSRSSGSSYSGGSSGSSSSSSSGNRR